MPNVWRLETSEDAFGTIDGIVCGAIKLQFPAKLEELPEEDWDMVMDIGLKGYFLCAQAAGKVMLERGSKAPSSFLSSVGGVQAYNGAGAYSISKAGDDHVGQTVWRRMGWTRRARQHRAAQARLGPR